MKEMDLTCEKVHNAQKDCAACVMQERVFECVLLCAVECWRCEKAHNAQKDCATYIVQDLCRVLLCAVEYWRCEKDCAAYIVQDLCWLLLGGAVRQWNWHARRPLTPRRTAPRT
jgi:hypothetical protein